MKAHQWLLKGRGLLTQNRLCSACRSIWRLLVNGRSGWGLKTWEFFKGLSWSHTWWCQGRNKKMECSGSGKSSGIIYVWHVQNVALYNHLVQLEHIHQNLVSIVFREQSLWYRKSEEQQCCCTYILIQRHPGVPSLGHLTHILSPWLNCMLAGWGKPTFAQSRQGFRLSALWWWGKTSLPKDVVTGDRGSNDGYGTVSIRVLLRMIWKRKSIHQPMISKTVESCSWMPPKSSTKQMIAVNHFWKDDKQTLFQL